VVTSPLPVLVFVHGGGFVGGSKGGPGQALHDNIGRFAVEHGLIGATINYRFAPEFKFPSGGPPWLPRSRFSRRTSLPTAVTRLGS
jgi:hypothetical protein